MSSTAKITNPLPRNGRFARAVRGVVEPETLGRIGESDVFVSASDDLIGIRSSDQLSQKLTLKNPDGSFIEGPFTIIEFETSVSVASPIGRSNSGFLPGGLTEGGAREYIIPNTKIDNLQNVTRRVVQ